MLLIYVLTKVGSVPSQAETLPSGFDCRFEHAARQVSEVHFDEEQMFKDSTKRNCGLVCRVMAKEAAWFRTGRFDDWMWNHLKTERKMP